MNLCGVFFVSMTFLITVCGTLINLCEPYLPVFLTRTFKYGKSASTRWSLASKLEIPKSYFRHFYFVAALIYYPLVFKEVVTVYVFDGEVSAWMNAILDFLCGSNRIATVTSTQVFLAALLLLLQVSRRFYETYFVSVFSAKAKINLFHYVVAMIYYPAVILSAICEAPKFTGNLNNNRLQIFQVGMTELVAVVLFLWAWYHQYVTTVILANLRKNKKGNVTTQEYKIPTGDWFDYLSSPHFTAEILMYTAVTLLLRNSISWWYVYAFVVSNQVEATLLNHWWYQSHFETFPRNIKALIPLVY